MSQRLGGGPAGGPVGPGGPAGNAGARGALLLAVAVVLGIVLLQQFDSGIDTGGQVATDATVPADEEETTTTRRVGLTTVPVVTTTTLRARPKGEVRVLVANGSGLRGMATTTTNALKNLGYATLTPTDATVAVDKTVIHFAEGYEAEARELAGSLSLPATVVTRMMSPPVAASDIGDAKLIVVVGADVASSTTTTAAPGPGGTTSTTRRL